MAESAREFFESIPTRVDPERLRGTTATYRFDIDGSGSWWLDINDGSVTVEESDADADCVIQASEDVFLRVVSGAQNPMTAYMTGKIKVKGDLGLATRLQQLFG